MAGRAATTDVYLEVGSKRTFAGALDWPGWCRRGRDDRSAIEALLECGPRYARALRGTRLGFRPPTDAAAFVVVERLKGDATTDFGAPGAAPSGDGRPVSDADLRRFASLLEACWRAFDAAAQTASGTALAKGPRGGGRELDAIVDHVAGAEAGYLARLAWKHRPSSSGDPADELVQTRRQVVDAVTAAVREGLPAHGPRGGTIWTPRYFVRRVAWHALDHAWEIEDRSG